MPNDMFRVPNRKCIHIKGHSLRAAVCRKNKSLNAVIYDIQQYISIMQFQKMGLISYFLPLSHVSEILYVQSNVKTITLHTYLQA